MTRIRVTEEHIHKGKRGEPEMCMVALGCLAAGLKEVSVGTKSVTYWDDGVSDFMTGSLPEDVQDRIRRYDGNYYYDGAFEFEVTEWRRGGA